MTALSLGTPANLLDVFLLFAVPIGGGIPAGVILGQSKGLGWLTMATLYFFSDLLLAVLFEPVMLLVIRASKKFKLIAKMREAIANSTKKTVAGFGAKPGPFLLVIIAFGVDPMTGRAVAHAAGHNFFAGWAIAILGDMIFFAVVMVSTIWLYDILGDGTRAVIIIMVAMLAIPALIRRFRKSKVPESC